MYSMQRMEAPKPLDRMYSTSTICLKEEPQQPSTGRKDTMLQSMLNAFNTIWEHVSKVPGNLIANLNNPLSVTVVQNEGIISNEFFKGLTTRGGETMTKQSLNIVETVRCTVLDEGISSKNHYEAMCISNLSKLAGEYGTGEIEEEFETLEIVEEVVEEVEEIELRYSAFTELGLITELPAECNKFTTLMPTYYDKVSQSKNYHGTMKAKDKRDDTSTVNNKEIMAEEKDRAIRPFDGRINGKISCKEPTLNQTVELLETEPQFCKNFNLRNFLTFKDYAHLGPGLCLSSLLPKKTKNVRVNLQCAQTAMLCDRAQTVQNQKRNKKSRDKARTQRYKKERLNQEMKTDIREDLECFHDLVDVLQDEGIDVYLGEDAKESLKEYTLDSEEHKKPITFTISDIKPKLEGRQRKAFENPDAFQRVNCRDYRGRYALEIGTILEEREEEKESPQEIRPRLLSESSVDSEDSYCIVFEAEPELSFKGEFNFDEEESSEEESDEDEEASDLETSTPKVKFDLKPRVHVMVQWDYAYRAARKGPWEEMARDRERFKGRINSIERVLRPILTPQHRQRIWQQRFQENS